MKQFSWKFPLTEKQGELIKAEKERRIVAAAVALQELLKAPQVKQLVTAISLASFPKEGLLCELMLGVDGKLDETQRGDGVFRQMLVDEKRPLVGLVKKYGLEAEQIQALHLALQESDPRKLLESGSLE